jgi:glycerol uptake facilitator-like aquaporin
MRSLPRRLTAEGIGSLLLAAAVVGSGVMAEQLAGGNLAIALLANTAATVAALATLIALLAPISGAHFNPAVSLVQALRGSLSWSEAGAYAAVQVLGCCLGAVLAHAMFDLPWLQSSSHGRGGPGQWLAEGVATSGLVLVVVGHRRPQDAAWMVAGWIGAAYWFTASTSFANPAITIARSLSNTFSGIRPADVPGFIIAQLAGALVALLVGRLLFSAEPAQMALSRRSVLHARSPEESVEPNGHPDEIESCGRIGAVPAAVDDEASTGENVEPLVGRGERAQPTGSQKHIR